MGIVLSLGQLHVQCMLIHERKSSQKTSLLMNHKTKAKIIICSKCYT